MSRRTVRISPLRTALTLLPLFLLTGLARPPSAVELSDYCNGNDSGDDTVCIRTWIQAGLSTGSELRGSNGTYLYRDTITLKSNLRLVCHKNHRTKFRRIGGSGMFFQAATEVQNVHIEGCDFDVDGGTANFLTVIGVNPGTPTRSRNIEIKNNRFYDKAISGRMSAAQRQYIVLLNCDDCRVLDNRLTEGGRIKVGRPGSDILIRNNTLSNINDNAITVVDINGGGVSERITIANNHITNPKGIGIFFGADGETQNDPALTTRDVVIEGNTITGDWESACIAGRLPATASGVRIVKNSCVKTGVCGTFPAGIVIYRTNNATSRAQNILIDNNQVRSNIGWITGQYPPLDMGGIFVSGAHDLMTITNNRIVSVGPRAIFFQIGADVTNANVTNNTMTKGTLFIDGVVVGTTAPNTTN
jgi:hypothetical protein